MPLNAFAACVGKGDTVVYVNGIFTTEEEAKVDNKILNDDFVKITHREDVNFINGYNQTHLAGAGDVMQAVAQAFGASISDYDLNTILMQIHPEVTTRKLLLVGHSQGSFYTSAMYDYLLAHGEPKGAVGVYNVATPAAYTAGGGRYLTAKEDVLIGLLSDATKKISGPQPLPPNVSIPLSPQDLHNQFLGHSFSDAYLAGAPGRVVADIAAGLSTLQPTDASNTGDCFTPPDPTLAYRAEQGVLTVADPAARVAQTGIVLSYQGAAAVVSVATSILKTGFAAAASMVDGAGKVLSSPQVNPAAPENRDKNFEIMKRLYGSSLTQADIDDLNGPPQSSTPTAPMPPATPQTPPQPSPVPRTPPLATAAGSSSGGGGGGSTTGAADTQEQQDVSASFDQAATAATSTPDAAATSTPATPPPVQQDAASSSNATSTPPIATSTPPVATSTPPAATSTPPTPPVVANNTAPFGDTFDSYQSGSLYSQGLWQNERHVWQVVSDGCYGGSGSCISSTGMEGANWKSGTDRAEGQWTIHFYADPFFPTYALSRVYFGSSAVPAGRSELDIQSDTSDTIKVLDNRSNVMASGLARGVWHSLAYAWDMTDTHHCTFSVRVDDGPEVSSAPSIGSPETCYDHIYSGDVIGSMALYNNNVPIGALRYDNISGGPKVTGCMTNCSGSAPAQLTDTFDSFNTNGWRVPETLYGTLVAFTADDGSTGNCHAGGCILGGGDLGGLGTASHQPWMYLETGVGRSTGAYTVWARAKSVARPVSGIIGICTAAWTDCFTPYVKLFEGNIPQDDTWHQYYFAWRQGASNVETCILQDDTDGTHCSWVATPYPLGTLFDGVVLSGSVLQSVAGDSLWFDDLSPASL